MSLFSELKRRDKSCLVQGVTVSSTGYALHGSRAQARIIMANLTLSVDDELLQKARGAAVREQMSVNALVREYLEQYVGARERKLHALDALDALAERTESSSRARWTRESLHERQANETCG